MFTDRDWKSLIILNGLGIHGRRFVKDLLNRSRRLFNDTPFVKLPNSKREEIVRHGLQAGIFKSKIYKAAIYLTQVVVYAGLYNNEGLCPVIDFNTEYNFESTTYRNYQDFLGKNITFDGNCS